MKNLCHRNVVKVFTSFFSTNGTQIITILEICETDLGKCISKQKEPFPYNTVIDWCCQIFCGLLYLHEKNIIHRDLKPEVLIYFFLNFSQNILKIGNVLKLTDFNLAKMLSE